jgi:hypothetical protein
MDNKDNLLKVLDDKYGISIAPVEDSEEYDSYKKISDDDFAKINACFQNVPLKSINDGNYYSGTYKVVYDKGLGVLQRSAKDPTLFRANIVAPGTNNEITGQALLQELNPSEIISNIFNVTSIATNQYFLARIDNKLESVEKIANKIQSWLEIDKGSQLWADGEYLKEVLDTQYISNNESLRQATLVNVQSRRIAALSNIKLYYEQLQNLNLKSTKDNFKELTVKLNEFVNYLSKFWYSVYLYELAYYLEVYLSNNTESSFLQKVISEMEKIVNMYQEEYDIFRGLIYKYIDEANALKVNERTKKYVKNTAGVIINSPESNLILKGIGFVGGMGAAVLINQIKTKKNAMKQEIIDKLESDIKPFSDLEPLKYQIEAINNIDTAYNKRLELIVTSNEAYIKCDSSRLN